jgi:hypothetical protein
VVSTRDFAAQAVEREQTRTADGIVFAELDVAVVTADAGQAKRTATGFRVADYSCPGGCRRTMNQSANADQIEDWRTRTT